MNLPYDDSDPKSIEEYSQRLISRSLRDIIHVKEDAYNKSNKGNFGNIVEKEYFDILPGNSPKPDFSKAGVELKSTGMKVLANKQLSAKEKLILNIINYEDVVTEEWETSSFLKKNLLLLMIFYLYEKGMNPYDLRIVLSGLWKLPDEDLRIMKGDWETITGKIRKGEAHDLSEGDTNYLIASRKGAGRGKDFRKQPYADIDAKQRAFAFRSSYVTSIFKRIQERHTVQRILKDLSEFKENDTLEDVVIRRFQQYIGLSPRQIELKLKLSLNANAKGYYAAVTKNLLENVLGVENVRTPIDEFQKAGVMIRTIRLRNSTNMPIESVSFPAFKCQELIEEEHWETSELRELLTKRFFFVIYKEDTKAIPILRKITFWNIPKNHLDNEFRGVWEDSRGLIKSSTMEGLPKSSDQRKSHIRPHGTKKERDKLPDGTLIRKHSFWLNARYLKEQLTQDIID